MPMFHSKLGVCSQVWPCLHSHCWGHFQKGVSSHGRQGWMFNIRFHHSYFCLLDAISSPSTYLCGSASGWSAMFSDFRFLSHLPSLQACSLWPNYFLDIRLDMGSWLGHWHVRLFQLTKACGLFKFICEILRFLYLYLYLYINALFKLFSKGVGEAFGLTKQNRASLQ